MLAANIGLATAGPAKPTSMPMQLSLCYSVACRKLHIRMTLSKGMA